MHIHGTYTSNLQQIIKYCNVYILNYYKLLFYVKLIQTGSQPLCPYLTRIKRWSLSQYYGWQEMNYVYEIQNSKIGFFLGYKYYEIFYEKRFISIFIHFANGNYPKTLKIMRWAIKTIFYLIRSIVPSKLSQSFITFITSIFIQNQS